MSMIAAMIAHVAPLALAQIKLRMLVSCDCQSSEPAQKLVTYSRTNRSFVLKGY